jgi:hypothetical protein
MSPARGFSMELGSVITVILATRLSKLSRKHFSTTCTNQSCRAACVYYSMYHRCHCRSRSLQRRLAFYQLAHGWMDLSWMVHHCSYSWSDLRLLDGFHHIRS